MTRYTKYRLPNGLRVLLAPRHDTEAVTVLAMTKVGSRYETAANNGVSHFLEHMLFKGTEKRPTALDVSKELDGVGASFNAFTSKDYTGYYVKLGGENVDLALDLIADILWHSRFAAEEIEKERRVIMEEINMYADNPILHIEELTEHHQFGGTHPLGRFIAGPKRVVGRMRRTDVLAYFRTHYFPNNMVLCVAGKCSVPHVRSSIRAVFGAPGPRRPPTRFLRFRPARAAPRVGLKFRETEQVQLGLGYLGVPYLHQDLPALTLLAVILGGNMSSRLFTKVREEHGLAYAVHASRSCYQDTGTFFIQAGLDKRRVLPALTLILAEVQRLCERGVTEEELHHAKEYLRGKMTIDLEDSENVANFLANQELLTNTVRTPEQRFAELRSVTTNAVQAVGRKVLRPRAGTLALIGPYRNPAPFRRILAGR